jgi:hypothetical protein
MAKGKAFFLVGHEDWGKSETLKALTNGNRHRRYWPINGNRFFIRRMSDDDKPKEYKHFLETRLIRDQRPYVLAALCPTLDKRLDNKLLRDLLSAVKRSYEVFFFVLRNKGDNPVKIIRDDEIAAFDALGTTKVYRIAGATPKDRAKALEKFIKKYT